MYDNYNQDSDFVAFYSTEIFFSIIRPINVPKYTIKQMKKKKKKWRGIKRKIDIKY